MALDAGRSIKHIKRETDILGVQNFTLIDVIAETRGLQAYVDSLEEEKQQLNGGGLVPSSVVQEECNDQYDQEIQRLQELLTVCKDREGAIEYEKDQAEQGLKETQAHNDTLDNGIDKLIQQVEEANKEATEANNLVNKLQHEIEELESTLHFREDLHKSELLSVGKYVKDYNDSIRDGTETPDTRFEEEQLAKKVENIKDDRQLIATLEAFAHEYQKLLDMAYAKEKFMLTDDISRLQKKHEDLREEISRLRHKQAYMEREIEQLKEDRKELERAYVEIATKRGVDRKQWAEERQSLEEQIARIKQEIALKEKQLGILVEADNKVIKESIALEMEIHAYREMMAHDSPRN